MTKRHSIPMEHVEIIKTEVYPSGIFWKIRQHIRVNGKEATLEVPTLFPLATREDAEKAASALERFERAAPAQDPPR